MRVATQIITVSALALFQTIFLPLNFALILTLIIISSTNIQAAVVPILAGSFFISLFSNLNFGISLISFSVAVASFLILRKFLPDRVIIRLALFIFSLVVWEISVLIVSRIYGSIT